MNKSTAFIIAITAIVALALVSAVLIVEFKGENTIILIAAIFGFTTPTIASLMTLLQSAINADKVQTAQNQIAQTQSVVEAVNKKVNGHLARLTQIVVDNAASDKPIDAAVIRQLAQHTEELTGQVIVNRTRKGTIP